jgi:hypothetical protein
MVLLVLAVVWVIALTPMVLRKLSERRVVSSVTTFNRALGHLRSHAPRVEGSTLTLAPIGFSAAAQRIHDAPRFDAGVRPQAPPPSEAEVPPVVTSRTTARRRRRVLASLAGATVGFFLLGLVPALGFLIDLGVVALVLAISYVALLVYFHQRAVERAQKVVALETRRYVVSALDRARAVGGVNCASGGGRSVAGGMGWSVTGAHRVAGIGGSSQGASADSRYESRKFVGARS